MLLKLEICLIIVTGKLSTGKLKAGKTNTIVLNQQDGDAILSNDRGGVKDGGATKNNYVWNMNLEELKRLANSNVKTVDGRPVRIEVKIDKWNIYYKVSKRVGLA